MVDYNNVKNSSLLTTNAYTEYIGDNNITFQVYSIIILGDFGKSVTMFTACWWFNIQYYSSSSNTVWQYCFINTEDELPVCTSFGRFSTFVCKQSVNIFNRIQTEPEDYESRC